MLFGISYTNIHVSMKHWNRASCSLVQYINYEQFWIRLILDKNLPKNKPARKFQASKYFILRTF